MEEQVSLDFANWKSGVAGVRRFELKELGSFAYTP